jgi:hypothetical protein
MLMTGAVGSILFTVAWLIMIGSFAYVIGMVMGGGAPSESGSAGLGGLMLLSVVLMLAGGITQGVGFLGLKQIYGGLNSLAGIFAILISAGILLAVVGGLLSSPGLAKAAAYLMIFSIILEAIFGGLAFLAAKNQASSGQGPLMIGGFALLGSGCILVLLFLLGLLGINIGVTLGKILGYLWIIGTIVGHVGATLVMLGQRKGGGAAPAAPAAG